MDFEYYDTSKLNRDQLSHFKAVLAIYDTIPEGCTHMQYHVLTKPFLMLDRVDAWVWLGGYEKWYWFDRSYLDCATDMYELPAKIPEGGVNKNSKVKSDGGSSSYYTIKLTDKVVAKVVESGSILTEDIIKCAYNNDFDFGNIEKCLKRLYEISQGGGKEGNSAQYEINKIRYTLNKLEAHYEA